MKLFINDRLINIIKPSDAPYEFSAFDMVINSQTPLKGIKLEGRVLITDGTPAYIDALLALMELKKLKKLVSVTFVATHYKEVKRFVKKQFRIVEAAGGLVMKDEKFLMIFRLGKWDLPKGKLEKDEKTIEGAVREVEEECAVKVFPEGKVCATWHTYVHEGRKILKKTTWYLMECTDDSQMKPQIEEDIEDLRWMTETEVEQALKNSYGSIIMVFDQYWRAVSN
jgi:8-oxo-dGTP pyrophosphatase MutT (NUDIX family)